MTYTLIIKENKPYLREMPKMEEPLCWQLHSPFYVCEPCLVHKKHLASLPCYPLLSMPSSWKQGDEIREDMVRKIMVCSTCGELDRCAEYYQGNYQCDNINTVFTPAEQQGADIEHQIRSKHAKFGNQLKDVVGSFPDLTTPAVPSPGVLDAAKLNDAICDAIQNACQLIQGFKPDAVSENYWSDWDESTLQNLIAVLKKYQIFYGRSKSDNTEQLAKTFFDNENPYNTSGKITTSLNGIDNIPHVVRPSVHKLMVKYAAFLAGHASHRSDAVEAASENYLSAIFQDANTMSRKHFISVYKNQLFLTNKK